MSSEGSDEALAAQQQHPLAELPTGETTAESSPADVRPASPAVEGDNPPASTASGLLGPEQHSSETGVDQAPSVEPAQVPLPDSPILAPSSPSPSALPSSVSSPLSKPPLAPPPRSRARPSPGPSGLSSPAVASRRASTAPVGAVGVAAVAKALDYGDQDQVSSDPTSSITSSSQPVDGPADEAEEWSTPVLPSFREAPQTASATTPVTTTSGLGESASLSAVASASSWVAPSVASAGLPALPPRSSSLGTRVYSSPGPSPWSSPSQPSPSLPSSSSSVLKAPTSPQIPDHEATGPLPKRRASSGVYTPASFTQRKGSAPATVARPPPLPTAGSLGMYRKASEGAGLGLGLPSSGTPAAAHAPLAAAAPASGGWGLWSSARSYFGTPLATPSVPTETISPLAPSPLASEPSPSLATASSPAETDTLLPTGSLSPTGVYTPHSYPLGLGSAVPTGPKGVAPRSPSVSGPSPVASAPRTPSFARKPAPAVVEETSADLAFSATIRSPTGAPTRKPVPAYSHSPEDDEAASTADSGVADATPPSSQGPSTPAWEQPETPSLPNDVSKQPSIRPVDGDAGFSGFKGLGKDMAVLEVALPLEAQEAQERNSASRVW